MKCYKLVELCSFLFLSHLTFTIEANRYRHTGESNHQSRSHHEAQGVSCFSRGPEDAGPHIFTAPLCLGSVHGINLFWSRASLIITNLPPRTNGYAVHYGPLTQRYINTYEKILQSIPIKFSDLKHEENEVWLVLCSDDSSYGCDSRMILYRIPTIDKHGKQIPRPQKCPPEPDLDLEEKHKCLVYVSWNSSHLETTTDNVITLRSKREAKKPGNKRVPNKSNKNGNRRKPQLTPKAPVRHITTPRPIRTTPRPIRTAPRKTTPNTQIQRVPAPVRHITTPRPIRTTPRPIRTAPRKTTPNTQIQRVPAPVRHITTPRPIRTTPRPIRTAPRKTTPNTQIQRVPAPVRHITTPRPIRTTPRPIRTAPRKTTPNTQIQLLPSIERYTEGISQTLSCESNGRLQVQWNHTYQEQFTFTSSTAGKQLNIHFTSELFDNNTYLTCEGKTYKQYHIYVTPNNHNITLLYYNDDTVNYNCHEYNLANGKYVIVISIRRNNTVEVFNDTQAMKFTETDNGTILFCSYFVYSSESADIYRYTVDKKRILIYNKTTSNKTNLTSEMNASFSRPGSSTDIEKYYIGAAIGVGVIILLVIILLVRKKYERKEEDPKLIMNTNRTYVNVKETQAGDKCTKAEESLYAEVANSNPTYAELDLREPSQIKRPHVEETAYAQILNPGVLYADLALTSPSRRNCNIEDTPYAQIVDTNTALYANMGKNTEGRSRVEETPYAEIANVFSKK